MAAFSVATQTDPLRVYVNVPQAYAHLIKPGQPATVVLGTAVLDGSAQ